MPEKDPREQLKALEKARLELASTQAPADELHAQVDEQLKRSVADDAQAAAGREQRQPPQKPR